MVHSFQVSTFSGFQCIHRAVQPSAPLILEHFYYPKRNCLPIRHSSLCPPSSSRPSPRQAELLLCRVAWFRQDSWSLGTDFTHFAGCWVHPAVLDQQCPLFTAEWCSVVRVYHVLFSPISDGMCALPAFLACA